MFLKSLPLAVALLLAPHGWAADAEPKTESAREAQESGEEAARQRRAGELASRYRVSREKVLELRERGLGWGEVDHAFAISQRSGRPLVEVLGLRDQGMGWGEIARSYGFSLGEAKGARANAKRELRDAVREKPKGLGAARGKSRGSAKSKR